MTNDTAASGHNTAPPAVGTPAVGRPEEPGDTRTGGVPAGGTTPEPARRLPPPRRPYGGGGSPESTPRRAAVGLLAGLALGWLAVMLWVAHASVSSDVGVVALATAASSLPSLVSAALVAGAAAGLVATGIPGDGRLHPSRSTAGRFGAAVGAGAVIGVAAGGAFVAGSGTDPARMVLAGTMAAGATIGGALAGARAGRVVLAIVSAGLAVFVTGFVLGLVKGPVQDFYGADGDEAARLSAAGWFAATSAIAGGLAAGVTAYRLLGGARRDPSPRWPAYLVAGAGPGVLLLIAEVIARTGGASLLGLVSGISDADRALQTWAGGSRLNNALVVMFVGAIVSIIALGRTLGSPDTDTDPGPDRDPGVGTEADVVADGGLDAGGARATADGRSSVAPPA